jgi:hypothetical protein
MGWTFGNLHVRKESGIDTQRVMREIEAIYGEFGFVSCQEENAEMRLALVSGENSAWVSVYADEFEEPQERESLGMPLAQKLHCPVLDIGCFDSDVLGLILYDPDVDEPAQAATGFMAEEKGISLINEDGWRRIVPDLAAFCSKIRAEHVLAEHALIELAEDLDLPDRYARADLQSLEQYAEQMPAEWLYLSRG